MDQRSRIRGSTSSVRIVTPMIARQARCIGEGITVICAATPWDGIKFQDRHLAERLSQWRPVLYVDPPRSVAANFRGRSGREWAARLVTESPTLSRLTLPAPPWPERPGVVRLTTLVFRSELRRAIRHMGAPVSAVIGSSTLVNPFGACREGLKVYWAQDDQVGGARMAGFSPERVARGEAAMVQAADLIVASNPEVARTWTRTGRTVTLIPFGCDDELFSGTDEAVPAPDVALPRPIAGFVGGLVPDRIDVRMLEAVADAGVSLLLVGPAHTRQGLGPLQELIARPNVHWTGPRPFGALPSYLRVVDVGLVPYSDTAFNRGSFPLKTLEYLAAGKPVVATDLPAIRWLDCDWVRIAGDPAGFADAVSEILGQEPDREATKARKAFARRHSWDVRARDFADIIDRALPSAGVNGSVPNRERHERQ